jgi:tRNA(Ile)-lysidine synthase TilS/MesJ
MLKGLRSIVKVNPLAEILFEQETLEETSILSSTISTMHKAELETPKPRSLDEILTKPARRYNSLVDGHIRPKPNLQSELLFHPLDEVVVVQPDQFLRDHPHLATENPVSLEEFTSFADRLNLAQSSGVIAAISGGPDSMSMALLAASYCAAKSIPLLCVTVDHALRPEAPAEALVTQGWLHELGIPHIIVRIDWHGNSPTHGIQEKARDARYDAILDLALQFQQRMALDIEEERSSEMKSTVQSNAESNPSPAATSSSPNDKPLIHVLMAHTADDNIETFWLRMAGCSGLYGLAGIAQTRQLAPGVRLVRPLLEIPKNRLYATLIQNKQDWASDPSNAKLLYKRNQVRHTLESLYHGADAGAKSGVDLERQVSLSDLQSLMLNFSTSRFLLDSLTYRFCKNYIGVSRRFGYVVVPTLALLHLPEILILRILQTVIAHVSGSNSPIRLKTLKNCITKINEQSRVMDNVAEDSIPNRRASPVREPAMPPLCLNNCIISQSRHKLTFFIQNMPNAPAILTGAKQPLPPFRADMALKLGSKSHWLDTWMVSYRLNADIATPEMAVGELPPSLYVRQVQEVDFPVLRQSQEYRKKIWPKLTKNIILSLPIIVDEHSRIVHFPFLTEPHLFVEERHTRDLLAPLAVRQAVHLLAKLRVEFSPKNSMLDPPASTFVGFHDLREKL